MSQPSDAHHSIDYKETADITEVHSAISRENAEPRADVTPIPSWLSIVCAVALCWAGAYIGIFHGGFNPKVYNEYESSPMAFFPLPQGPGGVPPPPPELPLLALGAKTYKETCINCHQQSGVGAAGVAPPLAGSEWVDGAEFNEKRLVAAVMKGVKGPITVKGATFNLQMQAWEPLGPKKIAAVLTYVRQEWGNKGGEITEAQVIAAKKELAAHGDQFTADELKQIPLDAKLEGAAAPEAPKTKVGNEPPAVTPTTQTPPPVPSGSFDLAESMKRGAAHYVMSCGTCHLPTGMGLPPVNPPLVGSEYVTGDARRVIAIPLKGINGPLKVGSTVFPGPMVPPSLMFPVIVNNDKSLADVLNYIRNSWGNKAEVITPELVAKVRAEFAGRPEPWTETELLKFPPAK